MPRRPPSTKRMVQETIKNNLDSILLDENLDSVTTGVEGLPNIKSSTPAMNFQEEQISASSEAKSMLDSLANFYFEQNLIEENTYIQYKKKIDSMNISSMMFQLKSGQHAITKLLEEIDLGSATPRLFEVLAQLQSQIISVSKDYQIYMEKMERNYLKIKEEMDVQKSNNGMLIDGTQNAQIGENQVGGSNPTSIGTDGLKSRGTRSIMEGIREIISADIIDVKPEIVDKNSVVNAREKLKFEDPNKLEGPVDGTTFEIEDDLFD
jgi:hypothetical protein